MNQRNKKVRERNKKKNQFFWGLLFGAAAILVIAFLSLQNGALKTAIATVDTVEDKHTTHGLLAFEEELFVSDSDGEALFMYPDGQRIVSKVKIATVYQGVIDESTKEKLLVANNNIKQSESRLNNKVNMPSDPAMARKEISKLANQLAEETDRFDYRNVYQYKNDMISRLDFINAQSGKESLETKNIQQLKDEIAAIENSIHYQKKQYYSVQTGVFSTKIDGFETLVNHESVQGLTVADFHQLIKQKPEAVSGVVAQKPFCKVINNFKWYIAGVFPADWLGEMQTGDSVKIRIPGLSASLVSGKIVALSEPENDQRLAVLCSTEYIEGLFSTRLMDFELVKQECTGFRIPRQALTTVDGEEGIFVVRSGVAKFRPVKTVYEDKSFILSEKDAAAELGNASGIVLYDLVILEPEKVYEDKIIKDYST